MNPVTDNGLGVIRLNESPSQKEGKSIVRFVVKVLVSASMKALPKRKGN